ncbi:MAG: POT family MFS transporter [Nitrospirota bacterium]|nr:POT family MFS transporter [Nitrospirota bacterium]
MTDSAYRTTPLDTAHMPASILYLVTNEAAERFSYYGMRAILVVFMTEYLLNQEGTLDVMGEAEARSYFHLFASAVYFFPIIGALLADVFLGKFRTIVALSTVYCLGHLALALDQTRWGLAIGLSLIAIGSGGIKPCVSANLGDQFGSGNGHLLSKAFYWFYFAINLGAGISTLLTPWLLHHVGPHVAFGVPGLLMLIATWVFWVGRWQYAHIPPKGTSFLRELLDTENLQAIWRLTPLFIFSAFFWSLYDQTGSAWVLQAKHMDRYWMGIEWLPSQIQVVNPFLIMLLIPVFSCVIYPLIETIYPLTPLRKISIGFFVTVIAFVLSAKIELLIMEGHHPNIVWQLLAFVVITSAEVMVSITCLEFSYTQAPRVMKSVVMALFLLSVSLGNVFTALVNYFIQNQDGSVILEGAAYYWFFAGVMLVASLAFIWVARRYRGKTYFQEGGEV